MHLDENDIARYVDGRLSDDERREAEAHLAECAACRNEVAAVHRLLEDDNSDRGVTVPPEVRAKAEELDPGEPSDRAPDPAWQGRRGVAAGIAVLVLALAGLLYWQLQAPAPSRLRSSSSDPPVLTVRAPADGATVAERPVFVCEPVSEALAYRVTLKAPDGTVVWAGDTTTTRVPLPPDVSLTPGKTYLWRAEALRSDGTTLRSTPRTFTYAP